MNKAVGLLIVLLCGLPPTVPAAGTVRCNKPLDSCLAEKRKAFEKRGELGLLFSAAIPDDNPPPGARYVICGLLTGGPAHKAGARMGDFLLAIDGKELATVPVEQLLNLFEKIRAGQTVTFRLLRVAKKGSGGEGLTIRVTASPASADAIESWTSRHVKEQHGPEEHREYLRRRQAARSPSGRAPSS